MSDCIASSTLAEFMQGRVATDRSATISSHLAECSTCQEAAARLADDPLVRRFQRSHREQPAGNLCDEEIAVLCEQIDSLAATPDDTGATQSLIHSSGEMALPAVLGRFHLLKRLGGGGFGVVYLAEDTQLGRQVALKLPRAGVLIDPDARKRFLAEMRASAGLHHPQIIAVYDAGECEGVYYLASAYCAGPTLQEWLYDGGAASPEDAAKIVLALAEAAEHAHANGVLHRDVKPANVLLDPTVSYRGLPFSPKLTDFSVAKLLESAGDATATNILIGTPRYMAPEQVSGRRDLVGPASDIYALGVVLYELLLGVPPIRGDDNADTLRRVLQDEPVAPRKRRPGLPRDLEAICLKCLEKSPSRRYANARLLADDLERFLDGSPTLARPIGFTERGLRWLRRHPTTAALISCAVAGLLFIVGALLLYNHRLNDFNASLGQANAGLGRAVQDARRAQTRAEASDNKSQQLLYNADMRLAARAWKDGDMRTLSDLLRRHIPSAGEPDRRGLEWRFLWTAAHRDSEPLAHEEGNNIYQMRLSPDGTRLASVGKDAVLRIYDLPTRRLAQSIETSQREVNGVAFSPTGEQIATAGDDGMVRLWNVNSGENVLTIPAHPKLAFNVLFTRDGQTLLSCGNDPTIRIWNAQTGALLGTLDGHEKGVEAIALSSDDLWVASAGTDLTVRVWDLAQRSEKWTGPSPSSSYFSTVAFSPDGQLLAAGSLTNHLFVWNAATGASLVEAHQLDKLHALAFSADGKYLATGNAAGIATLYDTNSLPRKDSEQPKQPADWRPLRQWQAHAARINGLVFSREGRLITGCAEGRVLAWDALAAQSEQVTLSEGEGYWHPVFTREGRLLSCLGTDLVAWDRDRGETLVPLPFQGTRLCADGTGERLVVLSESGELQLWNAADLSVSTKEPAATPMAMPLRRWSLEPDAGLSFVALSRNGSRCAVLMKSQGRVYSCNADSGQLVTIELPPGSAGPLAISPDGQQIAVGLDDHVLLSPAQGGSAIRLPAAQGSIAALAYSPTGDMLATGGSDRLVKLWNPRTGELLATLRGHRGGLRSLVFSADGRSLLSAASDKLIKVWNVATREELFDLYQHWHLGLDGLCISPDGRWLACSSEHYGRLVLIDLGGLPR